VDAINKKKCKKSKFSNYAECNDRDTRQSWEALPSAMAIALGKGREALSSVTSKALGKASLPLPSATLGKEGGLCRVPPREALGKATVTVNWRRQTTFLCRVVYGHSAKHLPSARQKTLDKEAFAITSFAE